MEKSGKAARVAVVLVLMVSTVWLPTAAEAISFGYFLSDASGSPAAAITSAGGTPVALPSLGSLDGIDVLWILNGSNSGYGGGISGNLAGIASFVQAGGVLSFHDRRVTEAATILPGAGGTTFVRNVDINPAATNVDINVVTPGTLVTNGPGGVIGNTTLDNGNWSNHGYATLASLPLGAVPIFNNGVDGQIVDFHYAFGAGAVYYSTIPLDFYLGGANAFSNIYAVNEAAFQGELAGGLSPVPEPAIIVLLGSAFAGLGWKLRRRH